MNVDGSISGTPRINQSSSPRERVRLATVATPGAGSNLMRTKRERER